MEPTPDELAGIVDLFGGLSRDQLGRGLSELAFKRGERVDDDAFDEEIDAAVATYRLVAVETDDGRLLVPGPAAFPELPEGAEDLPHILDAGETHLDRERVASAAVERFRSDVDAAIEAGDQDRIEQLLDVSYELSAWGAVDVAAERDRLVAAGE
ncbi:MAG: hypothetical protein ABEH35_02090 [Haloarculaceae archaeon]